MVIFLNREELAYDIQCMVKPFFVSDEVVYHVESDDDKADGSATAGMETRDAGKVDGSASISSGGEVSCVTAKSSYEMSEAAYSALVIYEGDDTIEIRVRSGADSKYETNAPVKGEEHTRLITGCTERLARKNAVKKAFYDIFSEITGKELPWGILTGIRPSKLAVNELKAGKSKVEAAKHLREDYFVSEEKSQLAADIAAKELEILAPLDFKNGYSLYIGIPFCPTTCLYCSFTSYPLASYRDLVDKYLDALEIELKEVANIFKGKTLNTIYMGGGTPTTLSAEQLERILDVVDNNFDRNKLLEFTVEAGRPDSITEDKFKVLKNHGVDRISINPQTMKQQTLDFIGRHHTVEDIKNAYALAKEIGFKTVNMDLILGLPSESVDDVKNTMAEIKKMNPENLTVHSLAIKRASRLGMKLAELKEKGIMENPFDIENSPIHQEITARAAADMGMNPYYMYRQKNIAGNLENTGYSKPGHEGIYNILIMEEVQTIVACGAGTVTKRVRPVDEEGNSPHIERCDNVKDVNLYISKIEAMIDRKRELFAD